MGTQAIVMDKSQQYLIDQLKTMLVDYSEKKEWLEAYGDLSRAELNRVFRDKNFSLAFAFADSFLDSYQHKRPTLYGMSWEEAVEVLEYAIKCLENGHPIDQARLNSGGYGKF